MAPANTDEGKADAPANGPGPVAGDDGADHRATAGRALAQAEEAFARFDVEAVIAHLSGAVRHLTAAGDRRGAAMACARLGDAYANALGNLVAGRAWFGRAARLVADEPPCLEQGWVAVAAMGCDVGDPAALQRAAELALDRARRFGDINLEAKALADGGLARVEAGRLDEGMAMLDEAMALACGPADDRYTASKSVCSFFTACYYAVDIERADSWANLLRRHGLIGTAPGPSVFLGNHCDSVQAMVLCELGRWGEAEALLLRAVADFEAVMPMPAWHPAIVLADLRVHQGRLADAEALLVGKDQALEALLPTARLHLARGDHELARAAAARGLRGLGGDRLRAAQLLTVTVEAELARGDLDVASAACADLAERVAGLPVPSLAARSAAARARVLAATGDVAGAIALVEEAAEGLDPGRLPWLRATLLLDLAALRERAGDRAGAAVDAEAAGAALAALDVVVAPGHRALLARLAGAAAPAPTAAAAPSSPVPPAASAGRSPADAPPEVAPAVLARDGRWWIAAHCGTTVRLQDTKGLRYLADLLACPGTERHALDLVDRAEGVAPPAATGPGGTDAGAGVGPGGAGADAGVVAGLDRRALGDAGPLLDARARRAYRTRVEELRARVDAALAAGREDEAMALDEELGQLVGQLAQAFGLGGRDRRAASACERARLNVTRALRAATARLADALPGAGAALDRSVRTGLYCAYAPADGDVRWIVRPALNGSGPD